MTTCPRCDNELEPINPPAEALAKGDTSEANCADPEEVAYWRCSACEIRGTMKQLEVIARASPFVQIWPTDNLLKVNGAKWSFQMLALFPEWARKNDPFVIAKTGETLQFERLTLESYLKERINAALEGYLQDVFHDTLVTTGHVDRQTFDELVRHERLSGGFEAFVERLLQTEPEE